MISKIPKIPKDYVIYQDHSMSKRRFAYERKTRKVNRYIYVTGIRIQDIKYNGPNFLNELSIIDCGNFERDFYKRNRKFRKFVKKYFRFVHKFIQTDPNFNVLRYRIGKIKAPIGVWVDLGGSIEFPPVHESTIEFIKHWLLNRFKKTKSK